MVTASCPRAASRAAAASKAAALWRALRRPGRGFTAMPHFLTATKFALMIHPSHRHRGPFLTFASRFGEGLCEYWNQGSAKFAIMTNPWPRGAHRGPATAGARPALARDGLSLNRHRALGFLIEHDLFGKPLHTFPDHALAPVRARDIAILTEKPAYFADENGPGRIAGQQDVVAALKRDEPCSGNAAGDQPALLEWYS